MAKTLASQLGSTLKGTELSSLIGIREFALPEGKNVF
jgi:hypothetical protein